MHNIQRHWHDGTVHTFIFCLNSVASVFCMMRCTVLASYILLELEKPKQSRYALSSNKSAVTFSFFFSGQLTLSTQHISTSLRAKDFPISHICHMLAGNQFTFRYLWTWREISASPLIKTGTRYKLKGNFFQWNNWVTPYTRHADLEKNQHVVATLAIFKLRMTKARWGEHSRNPSRLYCNARNLKKWESMWAIGAKLPQRGGTSWSTALRWFDSDIQSSWNCLELSQPS